MICVLMFMYCNRNSEESKASVHPVWMDFWGKKTQVLIN